MINKKYLNISEVSKMLQIEEHKIRYWDSIDPKTNKFRIDGISTKSKGGTRYFNKENLNKLRNLKDLIYENAKYNPSLKLANKFLLSKNFKEKKYKNLNDYALDSNLSVNREKINQILGKMRFLLK